MRFTLRTLFAAVTLIAIGMGVWFGYRRATMCEVRWLKLGSYESNTLFLPSPLSVNAEGRFQETYTLRFRHSGELMANVKHVGDVRSDRETLQISCENAGGANRDWIEFRNADQPKPGMFVIRGRVEDRQHNPVAHATIDLQGPFQFVNHFQTRDDGTFTMPLYDGPMAAPAGSGYFLRIRAAEETSENLLRWNTPSFSLSADQPEMEVVIVIPQ
jgi:hypothetical protein